MTVTIDYYFTSISPFVYLGHKALLDVAARRGASVAFKPVNLGGVWEVSGSVPLSQRSPTRQRYRLIEMQRAAEMRGLPINLRPKYFPADPTLADSAVIALIGEGRDPAGFMSRVFSGVWAEEHDIADRETIARLLEAAGFEAQAVLDAAASPGVAETRRKNTHEAAAADAIGVPAFVLNGEVFWGQDRIEYLDHALATGRKPVQAGMILPRSLDNGAT
jgi:2-hydroxychromene-2-carboxylate isomerase